MRIRLFSILTFAAFLILSAAAFADPARGPLKVLSGNPRYFTDGSGKAVFLAGSHTWNNLVEITRLPSYPSPVVDFGNFLSFLKARNHNCFRLWAWKTPPPLIPQVKSLTSMIPCLICVQARAMPWTASPNSI